MVMTYGRLRITAPCAQTERESDARHVRSYMHMFM